MRFWDLWAPNYDEVVWVFDSFFSYSEGDLDDELSNSFEEDCHQGELSENSGSFEASDFWFIKGL